MVRGLIMKIKKLLICNVFTSLWLLVVALNFLGYWLGCSYYEARYAWQWWWWRILFYINHNIMFWPKRINFFTSFFYNKEGLLCVNRLLFIAISLMISLISCIVIDFLLRKFLWNRIGTKKQVKTTENTNGVR